MAFQQSQLSFDVSNTNNVKTIAIVDTSVYKDGDSGFALQVLIPGYDEAVELNYYQNGVTTLNSNNLKLTHVTNVSMLADLPDGLWTAKISICPFESNWFEKSWYRTALLECKFYQAFLNLELNTCTDCYNKQKKEQLELVWTYIQGVHANVSVSNYKMATELYSVALKLVNRLIDCGDCGNN